ncbi:DUF7661 family protein [Pseudomonas lutea]|jgi:hypothetical protein|nr:hypothetical protein [Pseudomonas lutea]
MMGMMVFQIFGRMMGVKKIDGDWQVFRLDESQGKHSRLWEIVIPDFVDEQGIAIWLDDMYHESATAEYPTVVRIK